MQFNLLFALAIASNYFNLISAAPIESPEVSLTSDETIALFEQMFNVSNINADFSSSTAMEEEAEEFAVFYRNEWALRNQHYVDADLSTTAIDGQALAWDMANMFFTGTGVAEGCVFPAGTGIMNHKVALCGINLTGMLFTMTSIMVKLADAGLFEMNPTTMKTMFSTIGFNVADEEYAAFGVNSQVASLRESLPFVFEHIDAFRESETFIKFTNLNIHVDVATVEKAINNHVINDWVFGISTERGVGSVHGLNLTLKGNQYLFRMMANSRYANLPTKVVKNLFKLLRTEYPLLKKGQIAEFVFAVITTASEHTADYCTRMLTLFSKFSEDDNSEHCSANKFGFVIKDQKQNDVRVISLRGKVNC